MSLRKFIASASYKEVEIRGEKWLIRRLSFAESARVQKAEHPLRIGLGIELGLKDCDMTGQEIIDQLDAGLVDELADAIWRYTNGTDESPK